MTFPDDALAQAYADAVRDVYRACPREDTTDSYTSANTVIDTDLAEWSAAVVTHHELEGSPAIGHNTLVVVRSGRAVLVATTYGEGGPGPYPAGIAQDAAAEVEDVISAMCRFRDANC